jgi:ribulose-5-phosphate 4-epimerase/fuculose-1-phosphate aldolase
MQNYTRQQAIQDLVLANRILSNEDILEAFGHVSIRDPENPEHFLLSRSLAPLQVTEEDILIYDFDGNVQVETNHRHYAERILHGQIYKARPDVQAICHHHALPLLPFTTTGIELKPIIHIGCMFYEGIPFYDDYDVSDGMLIVNKKEGERIARTLGDKRGLLLRGHGIIVVGGNIRETVMSSIYIAYNAKVQYESLQLGQPKYLSYEEGRAASEMMLSDFALERAWNYWVHRLEK